EFYVGVTIDNTQDDVVIIASSAGGVEIEEVAKTNPSAIKKFYMQGHKEMDPTRFPVFVKSVFEDPAFKEKAADVFQKLVKVFYEYDCSLAEINPLVIDGNGQLLAADAKINFDDNALYRHEELIK